MYNKDQLHSCRREGVLHNGGLLLEVVEERSGFLFSELDEVARKLLYRYHRPLPHACTKGYEITTAT